MTFCAPPALRAGARGARLSHLSPRVCIGKMIRSSFDGRRSLIDLIAEWTHTKHNNATERLKRLVAKGLVPEYDSVLLVGSRIGTPVVTEEQWLHVRAHLPPKDRVPDDLYVMKYSNRDDVVKVGRSSNVENRRRALEAGHAFYIGVVAVCPGYGHLEQTVHQRLDIFKAHGVGREWFNVASAQAIKAIHWFIVRTYTAVHAIGGLEQQ